MVVVGGSSWKGVNAGSGRALWMLVYVADLSSHE